MIATRRAAILKRNDWLWRYITGSDDQMSIPAMITTTRPHSVQGAVSFKSLEGVEFFIPRPVNRRSTKAMVPIENANATMWKHSHTGKAHSFVLRGLFCTS